MKKVLGLAILCLAGCEKPAPIGTASGRVTFAGTPVTEARIVFQREDGWSVFALLDADGRFTVQTHDAKGLAPGKYLVAVRPAPTIPEGEILVGNQTPPTAHPRVPERFHSQETSGLVAIVNEGANAAFEFDLAKE